MSDEQTLIDMGFPKEKVEYALRVTNNKGLEPAMEWLLAHADEELPRESSNSANADTAEAGTSNNGANGDENAEPIPGQQFVPSEGVKSLRCGDCGKLIRDEADMQFHALKTGHGNFSESSEERPPLTEEERKAQLLLIEEKLKKKRLEREQREASDAIEQEKNRIRSGKDMAEARRRMEEDEMKKIVEQRKREKEEEKVARERVRAQIEADKQARKLRQNSNAAATATTATTSAATIAGNTTAGTVTSTTVGGISAVNTPRKEYTQTRLQIRLQDGSTLVETFSVKEQLSAVRVFIQMRVNDDVPFGLMTSFPRKVFSDEDYDKPLEALGLVPTAVIIVTKPH